MKNFSLVFALFILFFAVSCDSGLKFNNPNDINSDAYKGDSDQNTPDNDTDDTIEPDTDISNSDITDNDTTNADNDNIDNTDTTDTQDNDSDTDQGRKQGELYGECYPNETCNKGLICDVENNICIRDNANDDSDVNPDNDADTNDSDNDSIPDNDANTTPEPSDDDQITGTCTPGKKQTCEYQGDPATENIGPCRAGIRTCKDDGTWGHCEGEVLPQNEFGDELCSDGIDNDCDGTADNGTDFDGDGYGACKDCCETASACKGFDPTTIYPGAYEMQGDEVDNNCNGEIDEATSCDGEDGELAVGDYPGNAVKLAHAMGICGDQLVSAEISLAGDPVSENIADNGEDCDEGSLFGIGGDCTSSKTDRASLSMPMYDDKYKTFAAPTKFGNNITPTEGSKIAILSTGPWNNPTQNASYATIKMGDMKTSSRVPEDWINMMPDCVIPKSPSCGGTEITEELSNQCAGKTIPSVQDPIMLTLKVKAPMNARAFEFNLFFFSAEYPGTACAASSYNDFFIALLDSEHNTQYPDDEFQNPYDKNLAKDEKDNFVGVDLAPDGLFMVCDPNDGSKFASNCSQGDTLLQGTGFDDLPLFKAGGTGWLTTRGNVVPGETITLRLALWERGSVNYGPDHSYDSTVLLDGFKWLPKPAKAVTSQY